MINQPGKLLTETTISTNNGGWRQRAVKNLSLEYCQRLAKLIATHSGQKLDAAHPILSATLPTGERVQIIIPPVYAQWPYQLYHS